LLWRERITVEKPLITHGLPVVTADLEGVAPSFHVVLERSADPAGCTRWQPRAATRHLSQLKRIGAALMGRLTVLRDPLLRSRSLFRGKVAAELSAL
jgi:hypothetical protein